MLVALLAAGILVQTAQAAPAFDARTRLDTAIAIARRESYRTAEIDWPALTAKVHAAGDEAGDIIDLLPAYVTLTQELGDNHSFIRPTQAISDGWKARYGGPLVVDGGPPPLPPATSTFRGRREIEWSDRPTPTGRMLRSVTVPRMFGGGPAADDYATRLATAVLTGRESVCGYIVDLRGNVGGNIWPMAAGLSPLFGDGPMGWHKGADGVVSYSINLVEGAATVPSGSLEGQVFARASGWISDHTLASKPLAVLLDDAVGSSAEGLAIAFRDRPHTRSFGARTRGLATGNEEFDLGDGVTLGVASVWMTDRAGHTFPSGVPADVPIASSEAGGTTDKTLEAAEEWLGATGSCSA